MPGTSQLQRPSSSRTRGSSTVSYYLALLLCLFFSLTAAAQHYAPQPEPSLNPHHLPHFRGLDVGDNIHVTLIPGHKQKVVVLNNDESRLFIGYRNGTLILRNNEVESQQANNSRSPQQPVMMPIYVKIWTNQLNYLRVSGQSSVNSEGIVFPHTSTLQIDDNASVRLRGNYINFQHFIYNGSRNINIEWINSRHLIFRGNGTGVVRMAGVARILDAKLADASCLDAKYLRVRRAYVETKDSAIVMVTPIEFLNAFAMDYSNIYFYKTPEMLTRTTTQSGNVLQLAYND